MQKRKRVFFLQNHKETETEIEIFAFCTVTFEPIESFSAPGKCLTQIVYYYDLLLPNEFLKCK